MNIGMISDAAATGDPDRVALIIGKRLIGYGQLAATVERCAAGLAANGVAPGTRVAVVDGGSLLSIASVLGAARIGAAAALMNPALTTSELRDLMQSAGCADVGVAGEAHADRLREAGASKTLTAAEFHFMVSALLFKLPLKQFRCGIYEQSRILRQNAGPTGVHPLDAHVRAE